MRTIHRAAWALVGALVLAMPASAQPLAQGRVWRQGTTLNLSGGAATDGSETGAIAGTAMGWEITPAVSLEGSGNWLDRRSAGDAFAAALKVQVGLTVPLTAVPFLQAGIGLYRATFDSGARTIPDFYRNRMTAKAGLATTEIFTDPSFIFGGGVNVFVTRHIAIRPDVEAMMVRRDSQTYVVTAVTVHLAYHFEEHPIAPTQTRR
jgi:hypothetical protein